MYDYFYTETRDSSVSSIHNEILGTLECDPILRYVTDPNNYYLFDFKILIQPKKGEIHKILVQILIHITHHSHFTHKHVRCAALKKLKTRAYQSKLMAHICHIGSNGISRAHFTPASTASGIFDRYFARIVGERRYRIATAEANARCRERHQ